MMQLVSADCTSTSSAAELQSTPRLWGNFEACDLDLADS